MSKSMKPAVKPTEQHEQQVLRMIAAKRENLFNGLLFSIVSNPALTKSAIDLNNAVDLAFGLSGIALNKLIRPYGDNPEKNTPDGNE